ncbi:pyridoxal phosphate-dependent aminotransferase [Alkalicoccus urumqiensis]|uniref:LL-diaminopimelate aminotransferase n=1 Tax=Alkalicoccus urumqiensis TaxID=1548213 RepID=A0A2P6MLZ4_ALKUR|nr:pyridoxal phosphate-dependent aminotransferase [Alkalicoccus urumqiensis]PRO67271.1 LL-diaminopimelate aminotransferase [Alkalicoccus urumqiensis]
MHSFPSSSRLKQLPEQFFADLVKRAASKEDLINLGQGNPDQPTPVHIIEAVQQASAKPEHHKYSPFRGRRFLRKAAADFYEREYGVTLDPDTEIAVLPGAKTGLVELSLCLADPGDTVLLPDPGYPDYLSGTSLAGARTVMMPLQQKNRFLPDYGGLSKDNLDRARLMFLNYPNNPTGGCADPSFFAETVTLARRHHICVCHDFAYGTIGFDGTKPPSFLETPGAKETGIEIFTLSKAYNMAGWRIAFAAGNASVIEQLNLIQDHLFVSLPGAIQEAGAAALNGSQDCTRSLTALYERRRDVLLAEAARIGWEIPPPKGSFFVWAPVPEGFTSASFTDLLLEKAGVMAAPGHGFGAHGEGWVRLGLVVSEEAIAEAMQRIDQLSLFS